MLAERLPVTPISHWGNYTNGALTFGELLRQLRSRAGMTQSDLAAAVGFSISQISNLEKNQRSPVVALVRDKFVPALGLQQEPRLAQRLVDLAALARREWPAVEPHQHGQPTQVIQPQTENPAGALPLPLLPILGRERDLTAIYNRLLGHQGRLFTLIGPPGIGKTTLGLATARRLQTTFADGVYFIPLAAVSDPAQVGSTLMNGLGLVESSKQSPQTRLVDYLRRKQTLLLLDNFEQITAAAPLLIHMLQECPGLHCLVTSRAALGVRAEQRYKVAALQPEVAIDLFVQRARAVEPDFALTDATAAPVEQLCRHLDCLPLAIELIATQINLFAPQELLQRLQAQPLDLPHNAALDLEPRHRTLRHAIQHSYALLSPVEQAFFRLLGVFASGFDLPAVEALWGEMGAEQPAAVTLLAALINKSLVQSETTGNQQQRFKLLETLREYAREQLRVAGELDAIQRRHARYFCQLAEIANPLYRGPDEILWLDRLEANHDNLRAALAWSLVAEQNLAIGLRLVAMLWMFWYHRSYMREGLDWLQLALAKDPGNLPSERAKILQGLSRFVTVNRLPNWRQIARSYTEESIALYRQLDEPWNLAKSLAYVGNYAETPEEFAPAAEEAKAIFRRINDLWGLAWVPVMEWNVPQPSTQHLPLQESVQVMRSIGAKFGLALTLACSATQGLHGGYYERARTNAEEALTIFRQTGDRWTRASVILRLGEILTAQNQSAGLIELYQEGLLMAQQSGSTYLLDEFTKRLAALGQAV